jgi:hypothetical protein
MCPSLLVEMEIALHGGILMSLTQGQTLLEAGVATVVM